MTQTMPAGIILQLITREFKQNHFNYQQLERCIIEKLGLNLKNTQFVNCSKMTFTFIELLEFLVTKGKLLKQNQEYFLNPEVVCSCKN